MSRDTCLKAEALFSTAPHEVKVIEANSLASELWKSNEEISELITPVISESQANKFLSWEFLWLISLTISVIGLISWSSSRQILICRGDTIQTEGDSTPSTNQEAPSSPEMEESPHLVALFFQFCIRC